MNTNEITATTEFPGLTFRQRRFADLYLTGVPADQAYTRAGFKDQSPASGASRLLSRNAELNAYIAAERKRMADQCRLAKWQVVDFLCRVITTPVHGLPDNSDLIQEHVIISSAKGDVLRVRVKMISKIDAIKQLNILLGWSIPDKPGETTEAEAFSEFFRKLRNGEDVRTPL